MLRATVVSTDLSKIPFDIVVLTEDERHLRRRVITLQHGDEVLVDLPRAVALPHGARLQLDDGRHVEVIAAEEFLYEVRAGHGASLAEIAWHIGNRHLAAQIEPDRILIQPDHVIRDMLVGLGAVVTDISEPFEPVRGAYHNRHGEGAHHAHGTGHAQEHHEHHDHGHRHDR